jgi:hypothetical protein
MAIIRQIVGFALAALSACVGWFNPSVTRILAELRDKLEPFYNELSRSQARPPVWKTMLRKRTYQGLGALAGCATSQLLVKGVSIRFPSTLADNRRTTVRDRAAVAKRPGQFQTPAL